MGGNDLNTIFQINKYALNTNCALFWKSSKKYKTLILYVK